MSEGMRRVALPLFWSVAFGRIRSALCLEEDSGQRSRSYSLASVMILPAPDAGTSWMVTVL
jgi:hypothetical protein